MFIIAVIVGICECAIMILFEQLALQGIQFAPSMETLIDTALLCILSTPLLWIFSLRPLANKIEIERQEREKHAQLSKELHAALDIHALVSITDTQGKIIHANAKFCEVSGYLLDELIGQDHRMLNSGQHDKGYFAKLWQALESGKVWQGEICNRTKSGDLYWVDTTIVPLLDEKGMPRQYISIRRDISTQKEAESKLLALLHALDASSEMISVTDAEGIIQYVNPSFCEHSGWAKEDLMGQSIEMLNSPDSDPVTLAKMNNALINGKSWSGRILSRRRDSVGVSSYPGETDKQTGYWAEVSITPIMNVDKVLSGYVQIQRDISEQIVKEEIQQLEIEDTNIRLAVAAALQQMHPLETRFSAVLDILANLKSCHQPATAWVLCKKDNNDALDLLVSKGQWEEDVSLNGQLQLDIDATVVKEVTILSSTNEHLLKGQYPHSYYRVPLCFGGEILGLLIILAKPEPISLDSRLAMLRQIGEMMALALQQEKAKVLLQKSHDSALHAAEMKSEFLAVMSHEIRTPMNGVLGMLDLLKDTELTPDQWDLLETATNSAEALLAILNDILDISKLEAGKIELESIEFNLATLIEEVCTLLSGHAHAKGLELNCYIPVSMPAYWYGDPTRIRQILTNLIGNAVKFTDHGEVSINVIDIKVGEGESELRFEIKDTGIGISPEAQARLFQPFSQADTSTARRFGGTGLGLSISGDLVKLMKGKIGLQSQLGHGSLFWFTLPLKSAENKESKGIADPMGYRALIVDDNQTNRQILQHYMKHWGFIVQEADNAFTALSILENGAKKGEPIQLILTDLHMPIVDGEAFARAINDRPDLVEIPKLLLSSGGVLNEERCKTLRISQNLVKPVRQAQLFDAIMNALKDSPVNSLQSNRENRLVSAFTNKKVLVVEDNKVNQKVVSTLLGKFGLTVEIATNGLEALTQIEKEYYDLVLMDCQMPVMDGYEATRQLREREQGHNGRRMPVVALTAHASAGEREKCLAAGMDDYLSKPIERNKLAIVLSHWLGESEHQVIKVDRHTNVPTKVKTLWNQKAALDKLDGDKELLSDLISLFLNEIPQHINQLQEAFSQNNLPELADNAHSIKGMAGHFCAEPIVKLAAELEYAARDNKKIDFEGMINKVTTQVSSLSEELQGTIQ